VSQDKCPVCNGAGKMPQISREEQHARDAKVDTIGEETIRRILFGIPQDPDEPTSTFAGRPSLAQRSDAETLRDFLAEEIGNMLGEMTIVRAGLKRVDGK